MMINRVPSFEEYLGTLGRLSAHVDPIPTTPEADRIRRASASLADIGEITAQTLVRWLETHSVDADVLALTVGLTQEKMKNNLRNNFGTAGIVTLARTKPHELIEWLDTEFDLVRSLAAQRHRVYEFGDILVARAGTRVTAKTAGASGRKIEDELEQIAEDLRLNFQTRTRFTGRNGQSAPCDLLVLDDEGRQHIAVAAKGFDSTGSKLTDAVREIEEMASVRLPTQFVMAVIDGIGWKSRKADLQRIHGLWTSHQIDGMYTLATLSDFRRDLTRFATLHDLIRPVAGE